MLKLLQKSVVLAGSHLCTYYRHNCSLLSNASCLSVSLTENYIAKQINTDGYTKPDEDLLFLCALKCYSTEPSRIDIPSLQSLLASGS